MSVRLEPLNMTIEGLDFVTMLDEDTDSDKKQFNRGSYIFALDEEIEKYHPDEDGERIVFDHIAVVPSQGVMAGRGDYAIFPCTDDGEQLGDICMPVLKASQPYYALRQFYEIYVLDEQFDDIEYVEGDQQDAEATLTNKLEMVS